MKIAIIGTRTFAHLEMVSAYVAELEKTDIVLSGGAPGPDTAAEKAARARGLAVQIFHADWQKHGKQAGMIRNHALISAADRVVAFWDGASAGTKASIEMAKRQKKQVLIIGEEPEKEPEAEQAS